jgi:hypothetical protein
MKLYYVVVIIVILGFVLFVIKTNTNLTNKHETLIYACGYLAGQTAIMTRMQFTPPKEVEGCAEIEALAVKNGFSTAASPQKENHHATQ